MTAFYSFFFFFFNDTATTEIYTLSLHDALPILLHALVRENLHRLFAGFGDAKNLSLFAAGADEQRAFIVDQQDRKSTRLNSSHSQISYAVFCLKKKKNTTYATSLLHATHLDETT